MRGELPAPAHFGLLSMALGVFVGGLLVRYPVTNELSAWYAGSGIFVLVAVLLIAYSVTSDALLGARVGRRVEDLDLPFDRQLRKSEMIRRAVLR